MCVCVCVCVIESTERDFLIFYHKGFKYSRSRLVWRLVSKVDCMLFVSGQQSRLHAVCIWSAK